MKKISKRKAAQAKKAAAKRSRYEARKDKDTSNSKCAERRRARARGVPMSSRAHENRPWWQMARLLGTARKDVEE